MYISVENFENFIFLFAKLEIPPCSKRVKMYRDANGVDLQIALVSWRHLANGLVSIYLPKGIRLGLDESYQSTRFTFSMWTFYIFYGWSGDGRRQFHAVYSFFLYQKRPLLRYHFVRLK